MKNFIIPMIAVLSAFSCQKVLELDAEVKTPKLVVNSLFNENDAWKVKVTRSLSVIDDGDLSDVDNATVRILDGNNNLVEQLIFSGNYYISPTSMKPVLNQQYKIEVSAPSYTAVSSQDRCPNNIPITKVDTSSRAGEFGGREYTVSVEFQDIANSSNYYGIEITRDRYVRSFNSTTGQYDTSYIGTDEVYMSSSNPIVDNSGADSYARTLTFKDNLFDGQRKAISFNYSTYNNGTPDEFQTYDLRLLSLTESTYKYIKTIEAYNNVDGNPFAEPVQVFTNVENGFGIFGGQSNFSYKF